MALGWVAVWGRTAVGQADWSYWFYKLIGFTGLQTDKKMYWEIRAD